MRSWGVAVLVVSLLVGAACEPVQGQSDRDGATVTAAGGETGGASDGSGEEDILISEAQVRPTKPTRGGAEGADPQAAACEANGGDWGPVCMDQSMSCVYPYADAGQACDDGDDCIGDCEAVSGAEMGARVQGQCEASSYPCGCATLVENGRSTGTLCID